MDAVHLFHKLGIHQEKSVQVLQVFFAAVVVIDYTVSTTIQQSMGAWFYLLPAAIVVVALAIPVAGQTTTAAKLVLSGLHYGFIAWLLIGMTDAFGPYFQFLILLVFASVIWFRQNGMLWGLLASYLIIGAGMWHQVAVGGSFSLPQAALYVIGLTVLGILFERVVAHYQGETEQARQLHQDYYFERTRLLSLINSMADAVVAVSKTGEISLYNGAVLDLLNTNEVLQGKSFDQVMQLKDDEGNQVDILGEAARNRAPTVRDDLHFLNQDKSVVNLYISVSPVSAAGSTREHTGFIIVMRDITKQKTLDEQRDEFISVTSHELRTPIAVAEANISTALMPKFAGKLTKKGKELLDQAHENVLFLSNLVNDLNMLSKAEQENITLSTEQIDPAEFVRKLGQDHKKQTDEKRVTLEIDIDDDIPAIATNADALREVLQNFLTNAIKYTEENGTITLWVYCKNDTNEVVFAVKDTGIGISKTDQKHVFEKFYRSEDYRTRKSGGTGLGLYIIKRLVERLGGRVWFESQLNKGSTFYCALPIRTDKSGKSLSSEPQEAEAAEPARQ